MTDHKAEWVLGAEGLREGMWARLRDGGVVQVWRVTVDDGCYCSDLKHHCASTFSAIAHDPASLAAAPAASEGEDGAVAWAQFEEGTLVALAFQQSKLNGCDTPLYTRPAAQVAATPKHDNAQNDALTWMRAQAKALGMVAAEDANAFYLARFIAPHIKFPTPKHDEGREESPEFKRGFALGRAESEFLCGLIADPKCDRCGARNPAEAESMCRPSDDSCPGSSWPLENLWNLATQPAARRVTDGVALIAAERQRQIDVEGWSPEHDDEHATGDLARAAGCYVFGAEMMTDSRTGVPVSWPWEREWWKPGDRIRDLTKAGALIAAEIDRLKRAESFAQPAEGVSK